VNSGKSLGWKDNTTFTTVHYVFQGFLTFFSLLFQVITEHTDKSPDGFFDFAGVWPHVFGTSSVHYISMLFAPIATMAFDVCWKVFSNMFYPTQTQIHTELEAKEFADIRNSRRGNRKADQSNSTWRS
jgi:hypothetical protein